MKYTIAVFYTMAVLISLSLAYSVDDDDDDSGVDFFDAEKRSAMEAQPVEQEKREAVEFFKRLFHPFSTKNEEMKRETREVYEEKCESVVPTQRFCPDLKTW